MGGDKKRGMARGRQGGPATCGRGQVRVETRFALNEDEETVDNEATRAMRGAMFMPLWRVDQMLMAE